MFEDWQCHLRELPVEQLTRPELCDVLAAASRLRSSVDALEARAASAVAALDDNGAPASTVLRSAGHASQREADRRARRSETLAMLPAAADALADGSLTAEHVEALGRAVEATSAEAVAESDLVALACRRPADMAARDTRDWIRRTQSAAEVEAVQARRRAARCLSIWENDDGMMVLHGEFDPVVGTELKNCIEAEADRLYHADGGRSAGADVRTPAQRRADALSGLLMGPRSAATSSKSGVRHQIPVIAVVEGGKIAGGRLVDGSPVPLRELERLACGSDLFGMLFSGDGQPLWHGDRVRLATDAQWRGLITRDGGCGICSAEPSKCEAHHVIPWLFKGPTDITNLVLLCRHHHHLVHDQGYTIRRGVDGWELVPP